MSNTPWRLESLILVSVATLWHWSTGERMASLFFFLGLLLHSSPVLVPHRCASLHVLQVLLTSHREHWTMLIYSINHTGFKYCGIYLIWWWMIFSSYQIGFLSSFLRSTWSPTCCWVVKGNLHSSLPSDSVLQILAYLVSSLSNITQLTELFWLHSSFHSKELKILSVQPTGTVMKLELAWFVFYL